MNTIVLTQEKHGEQLAQHIGIVVKFLLDNDYECIVRLEEEGIVVIEYDCARDQQFGNAIAQWVVQNET